MQDSQNIQFLTHDKEWHARTIRYELKQLRRETEHLLKKSKQRSLSAWELERMSTLGQEIGMLALVESNCELEELLAA